MELLVVVAIIGILAAILLPAINLVRKLAGRTTSQNNLKQTYLGVLGFTNENDGILPGPLTAGVHSWYNSGNPFYLGSFIAQYLGAPSAIATDQVLSNLKDKYREKSRPNGFKDASIAEQWDPVANGRTIWNRAKWVYPGGVKITTTTSDSDCFDPCGYWGSVQVNRKNPRPLTSIPHQSDCLFIQDYPTTVITHRTEAFYGKYISLYFDGHVALNVTFWEDVPIGTRLW